MYIHINAWASVTSVTLSALGSRSVSLQTCNAFLLADRTTACNIIWPALVTTLSSAFLQCCALWPALRVGVESWKLHRRVSSRALPIHFFGHFCSCRMYRLAMIIAVGCIFQTPHAPRGENRTAEMSASGVAMSSVVTWPWPFQTQHFSDSVLQPYRTYVVRCAQYDRLSQQQLGFLFNITTKCTFISCSVAVGETNLHRGL